MKYKSQNKSIMAIAIAIVFVLAQFILCLPIFSQKIDASAASSNERKEYSESVSITNGNFADTTGSSYPRTPSNWTAQEGGSPADYLKAGVIDTSASSFSQYKEDYGLTTNPETASRSDDYILMMNAEDRNVNYGYRSSSITLDANSYYEISFSALTQSINNNGFSAYIISDSIENTALNSFISVQTGVWNTFTFYIATGNSSTTVSLELWIGTKSLSQSTRGAVFFDNVRATKYTETAYENLPKDTQTSKTINLQSELVNLINNGSFENGADGWTRLTTNDVTNAISGITSLSANGFDTATTQISTAPSTNMINARNESLTQVSNQRGLFINNLSETSTGYKSNSFIIDRFETYAISVWLKTGNLSTNGASIILTEVDDNDEDTTEYSSKFNSLTTASFTNDFTNNWAQYTFYVQGNPFSSTEMELQLWLGTADAETQGYAFFDEIRVTKVSPTEFSNATDDTYNKKLTLSSLESLDIANSAFNLISTGEKVEGVYEPSDWTLSSESGVDSKYSGIINTKSEYFDATSQNYNLYINPGVIPNQYNNLDVSQVSNNILMIYNATNGDQTYTSSEYSLSTETTYKITFYAKIANDTQYATASITNDGNTVARFIIDSTEWTQYTFYIKTGTSSETIIFALSLGSENTPMYGHAFFDNFISTTVEDDIYNIASNSTTALCDLTEENFLVTGDQINGVYTPYMWNGTNNSNEDASIIAGIINSNNNILPSNFDISNEDAKTDNNLVIFSPNDTYYTFTSNTTYTFSASSYYKVDITFKVYNIGQNEENVVLDDDDNPIPYGVFLQLGGLNLQSDAITTTNDEYVTYSFYIRTGSAESSSSISIELGGANALTKGGVSVSSIVVAESTEDAYNEISDDIDNTIGMKADLSNGESTGSDEDDTNSTPNFQLIDIAGIIIVVALVIAVIGTIVRQVMKRKKKVETTVGKYDRTYDAKKDKNSDKTQNRLEEVEAELAKLNETISVLTRTQNDLIAKRNNCTDPTESEKLLKQIDKISNELSYELDNKESVEKERNILKSMLDK